MHFISPSPYVSSNHHQVVRLTPLKTKPSKFLNSFRNRNPTKKYDGAEDLWKDNHQPSRITWKRSTSAAMRSNRNYMIPSGMKNCCNSCASRKACVFYHGTSQQRTADDENWPNQYFADGINRKRISWWPRYWNLAGPETANTYTNILSSTMPLQASSAITRMKCWNASTITIFLKCSGIDRQHFWHECSASLPAVNTRFLATTDRFASWYWPSLYGNHRTFYTADFYQQSAFKPDYFHLLLCESTWTDNGTAGTNLLFRRNSTADVQVNRGNSPFRFTDWNDFSDESVSLPIR